jgi:3-dehydroquinate synthase
MIPAAGIDVFRVELGSRGYDISIGDHCPQALAAFVRDRARGRAVVLVTDANVAPHAEAIAQTLQAGGFAPRLAVIPAGESQKSLATVSHLYDRLAEIPADRETLLAAVGGGVVGDVTGFVAATYVRGLRLLMVPTTLLAAVDSSVGGKTGVNHPKAKNLIGAFHQPVGVWIDTALFDTLPDREYRSGLAEVVKYGVILDPELFAFLESQAEAILRRDPEALRHIIVRSCRLKADIVAKDEREETGLRAILNYGHTFAHAFETAAGYGTWLHGEAVAAGMIAASRLAERFGRIDADVTERQRTLLARLGLPIQPGDWPVDSLLAAMRIDKKSQAGRLRFVLPTRLGAVSLCEDANEDDVRAVLASM